MTTTLSRAIVAAMAARSVTSRELAAAVGVGVTTVSDWRTGHSVPLLRNAGPLADALCEPRIAVLVARARTTPCPVCGRLRVHGSNVGRYCGLRCRSVASSRRGRGNRGKDGVLAQHRLRVFGEAIDELCRRWCEPGGLCRDATCPVQARGLSPLPLARRRAG